MQRGRRFEPGDRGIGGLRGEGDGVDGDAAFARRGGEAERFAGRLPAVAEEDDAAAARGPRQRQFERPLQVRFAALRGCPRRSLASGPVPAPVSSAPPPNWTTWQSVAAAFVGLASHSLSASPEAGPTLSERSRTSVVGGGEEPIVGSKRATATSTRLGHLEADRDRAGGAGQPRSGSRHQA